MFGRKLVIFLKKMKTNFAKLFGAHPGQIIFFKKIILHGGNQFFSKKKEQKLEFFCQDRKIQ